MANHDHQSHDSSMMWLMAVCCLAPLIVLAFLGGGFSFGASWPFLVAVVVMVAAHGLLMRGHHGEAQHDEAADSTVEIKQSPDNSRRASPPT